MKKKTVHIWLSLLTLLCLAGGAFAQQTNLDGASIFGKSEPLLSPDVAFQGSLAKASGDKALTLKFEIAEGYYLYRDRFRVETTDSFVELAEPEWPTADIYSDAYFGESAIYRGSMAARIPILSASSSSSTFNVTYQGCADIGVCFPPTTKAFTASDLTESASLLNQLRSLSGNEATVAQSTLSQGVVAQSNAVQLSGSALFTNDQPELLSPSEAYRPYIQTTAQGLTASWDIEPGYYLYRDKLTYQLIADDGSTPSVTETVNAQGEWYEDEFFGKTRILRLSADDQLLLAKGSKGSGTLTLNYQGCADIGVCFPPESLSVPVRWDATSEAVVAATATPPTLELSEQDQLASQLANSSLWFNAAAFFVFGLLLAFTPCVLPMIPILSSLILGGGEKQTTAQAFRLSVIYVLGMALTYTLVGVLVGLSGYNIQAWFQDPIILIGFALLFVILSLAMFGVYELQMPARLQTRLTQLSNRQSGGRSGGVFTMGILSALIVGPCVTAPLMGALIYIADTGDAVVGGTALFALSIGMGTPLLLIGTSAGKWVPKAGGWMSTVKIIFGFLMLGMAIWMLSRFLEPQIIVLLSAALALCAGVWAVFEYAKSSNAMALRTLGTAAGLVASVYGMALIVGALAGTPSLLKPLQGFTVAQSEFGNSATEHLSFQRVKSLADLEASIATAKSQNRPVMLDFYADWCVSCKEMEAFTFTDATVQAQLNDVLLIQADVTANDKLDQALLKHFGLFGPPAIIFYDRNGDEIRNARLVGFLNAEAFSAHLDLVLQPDVAQQAALSTAD